MFTKWRIITITRNVSDGESQTVDVKDTEKGAIDKFYNNLSSYGTNPQTKTCEVVLFTPKGDIARIEQIDNSRFIVEE